MELRNGLVGGEQIVANPALDLQDGAKVKIAQADHGNGQPREDRKEHQKSASNQVASEK